MFHHPRVFLVFILPGAHNFILRKAQIDQVVLKKKALPSTAGLAERFVVFKALVLQHWCLSCNIYGFCFVNAQNEMCNLRCCIFMAMASRKPRRMETMQVVRTLNSMRLDNFSSANISLCLNFHHNSVRLYGLNKNIVRLRKC